MTKLSGASARVPSGVATRLCQKGFMMLLPNVMHRYGPVAPDGYETDDAARKAECASASFLRPLAPEQMASDGKAYVDFLAGARTGWCPGKVGIVGLLLHRPDGGARLPRRRARQGRRRGVGFHGGFLVTTAPDGPRTKFCRLAQGTSSISVMRWKTRRRRWSRSKPFQKPRCATGTARSRASSMKARFTVGLCPSRDVYNEMQAERAFRKLVAGT